MNGKERDLEELIRFQKEAVDSCQQLAQLGRKLKSDGNEAAASLQDDVSRHALDRIEDLADKLIGLADHGGQQMSDHLSKTRAELDRWNNMQ